MAVAARGADECSAARADVSKGLERGAAGQESQQDRRLLCGHDDGLRPLVRRRSFAVRDWAHACAIRLAAQNARPANMLLGWQGHRQEDGRWWAPRRYEGHLWIIYLFMCWRRAGCCRQVSANCEVRGALIGTPISRMRAFCHAAMTGHMQAGCTHMWLR